MKNLEHALVSEFVCGAMHICIYIWARRAIRPECAGKTPPENSPFVFVRTILGLGMPVFGTIGPSRLPVSAFMHAPVPDTPTAAHTGPREGCTAKICREDPPENYPFVFVRTILGLGVFAPSAGARFYMHACTLTSPAPYRATGSIEGRPYTARMLSPGSDDPRLTGP